MSGRSKRSPTGVVVYKACTARFDSSTGSKIWNVHMWVDANHEPPEIYIPCSFEVKLSIAFVLLTKCFMPIILFLDTHHVFIIINLIQACFVA